ncbi:MAG: bifunctional phosphopantothenoylcysteine decarboxylase/phosphopantothenate--cysteine ligase CoaBC [Methanomassiliicoccus sp.]|nr:bifunctional phosphopantothenoylcysteine decarboxylase/phosphopantothenate--cysteine ligase CoaBC [Methanomassiliicoccus sp.]
MHPSEAIKCTKGRELEGRRIVLGITGSIAAVETFELVRELMRHGADVRVVMTSEAVKLVTPYAMEFASGNKVITALTGEVEHVELFGDYPGRADMLLVAPCTANTISKMALGIDDTPVTTMATVAIGSRTPVLVAPAMHLAMYENPAVQDNVGRLVSMGARFVGPVVRGKKARVATIQEIVDAVLSTFVVRDLVGKRVLIIGGSTEEPIDDVRVVTNTGTGETAILLARAAAMRGAKVELWTGRMSVPVPSGTDGRTFSTVEELVDMVGDVDHDAVIVPASLSDYAPEPAEGKLASGKRSLTLTLRPLPKVLPLLRPRTTALVGFKAEIGVSAPQLVRRARARLEEYGLDLIVANDLRDVSAGRTRAVLVTSSAKQAFEGTKADLANLILDEVAKVLG